MPFQSKYIFSAAMDVDPDKDALFNEVYDKEHVPMLLKVPGVVSVARFKKQEVMTLIIGGVLLAELNLGKQATDLKTPPEL